jgi:hypothetical protein
MCWHIKWKREERVKNMKKEKFLIQFSWVNKLKELFFIIPVAPTTRQTQSFGGTFIIMHWERAGERSGKLFPNYEICCVISFLIFAVKGWKKFGLHHMQTLCKNHRKQGATLMILSSLRLTIMFQLSHPFAQLTEIRFKNEHVFSLLNSSYNMLRLRSAEFVLYTIY